MLVHSKRHQYLPFQLLKVLQAASLYLRSIRPKKLGQLSLIQNSLHKDFEDKAQRFQPSLMAPTSRHT
jgi:hypothetical protein